MGLDMYLNAKLYISPYGESDVRKAIAEALNIPEVEGVCDTVTGVTVRVMQWRKANAIHQWFVTNCGNGNDNCEPYYVELEKLQELREICLNVLANRGDGVFAEENLPAQSGFFFGSTEYDDGYYYDVECTVNALSDENLAKYEGWDFEYQASW